MDENMFDKLKGLFSKSQKIVAARPTIHEQWHTEEFLENIETSEISEIRKMCGKIADQFNLWKLGITSDENFYFMHNDKISAFAFDCKPLNYDHHLSMRFISFLASQFAPMQYVKKLVDVLTRSRGENMETVYKIYLKPSNKLKSGDLSDQLYGNIQIEYLLINNHPMRISLKASKYHDQNFGKALPFEELLERLA